MSEQPTLTVKSGSIPIPNKNTIKDILQSRMKAITLRAWGLAYVEYYPSIAKKTGRLRVGFNKAGQITIQSQSRGGGHQFTIARNEVMSRWVKEVPYAEHHQEVGPTGLSYYKRPTTEGTKPFKWAEFQPILKKHVKQSLRQEIQQIGMELRRGS
jgi:hypothetical protein